MKKGFTLIEVMMAVIIISIVIASLLEMMGNSSNIFSKIKTDSKVGQYASFLISSPEYGFEDKRINIHKLAPNFELDSSLRSRLKSIKTKVIYTVLEVIDMSEFDESQSSDETLPSDEDGSEKEVSSTLAFEVGMSTLRFKDTSTSLIRLRIQ